ncbi:MAG: cytochrome c maturation protein CcmE [Vicinamibacterales bacterium]
MTAKPVKILVTVVVIVVALTGLLYATLREDTQYYKHVDEVMGEPAAWQGKRLQLHGFVTGIEKRRNSLDYRFKVQSNGSIVSATYTGVVPDTFKEGSEVVLKGKLSDAGFAVERNGVMAKCPSKYEPSAATPATPGS